MAKITVSLTYEYDPMTIPAAHYPEGKYSLKDRVRFDAEQMKLAVEEIPFGEFNSFLDLAHDTDVTFSTDTPEYLDAPSSEFDENGVPNNTANWAG